VETAITIIVSALLLSPLIFVIVAFRLVFPRHALKVKDVFLVPIALLVVVVFDSYQIYLFNKWLPVDTNDAGKLWVWLRNLPCSTYTEFANSVIYVISLCFVPFAFTYVGAWIAYLSYGWFYTTRKDKPLHICVKCAYYIFFPVTFPITLILRLIASLVKNQILNHFGQVTYFDKRYEQLMVDVLNKDQFLYSGIYSDFFMEDGKFVGLSISNILRYKYIYDKEGKKLDSESYLIPNSGALFIPSESVSNIHFWKLSKSAARSEILNDESSATFIAWLVGVYWSSKCTTAPRIKMKRDLDKKIVHKFLSELNKTKIPLSYLPPPDFSP
jgi:hypothetical protein